MVYTDRHWRSFYQALGCEAELDADPRFKSMTTRTENIKQIYAELSALMLTRTTAEWLKLFDDADIPAMPLHTPDTLLEDPHLKATNFFKTIDHPSEGKLVDMAVPSQWSETQPSPTRPAPRLGEHSAEVLAEIGYSEEKIASLLEKNVIALPKK